jgi:HD-GYP domain-containing protein (c-di-GMP phosphodiesterase class II)
MLADLERKADENRQLFDTLKTTYATRSVRSPPRIDCKDRYTEGHSVRVGKYSEIIGEELGWSEDEIEGAAGRGLSSRCRQADRRAKDHQRAVSHQRKGVG